MQNIKNPFTTVLRMKARLLGRLSKCWKINHDLAIITRIFRWTYVFWRRTIFCFISVVEIFLVTIFLDSCCIFWWRTFRCISTRFIFLRHGYQAFHAISTADFSQFALHAPSVYPFYRANDSNCFAGKNLGKFGKLCPFAMICLVFSFWTLSVCHLMLSRLVLDYLD